MENDDGTIALADAFVTCEPGGGLSASAGQQAVPFGVYDTNLISDPLPKGIGDTAGVSLVLAGEAGQLGGSLFSFDAQNVPEDEGNIAGFGAGLGFAAEADGAEFGVNVSWINHVGDSGEIGGAEPAFAEMASGMAASASARLGPASVLLETAAVLNSLEAEDFDGSGSQPSAWSFEVAYDFALGDTHASHYYDALGIRNIYLGAYERIDGSMVQGPSVSDLVAAASPDTDAALREGLDVTMAAMGEIVSAAEGGEAYDQQIGEGNPAGNARVQAAIDALTSQTSAIEGAVSALNLAAIDFEGSDSLDDPEAVFE